MNTHRFFVIFAVLAILVLSLGFYWSSDSYYFKINKSLELYGSVFKELTDNYVEPVEPEELVRKSIQGMLKDLDPYTVFLEQDEIEEYDVLTTGQYVGFGITVAQKDSFLVITDIQDNNPAKLAGLRLGDKLISIDSANVSRIGSKELRKYTRGERNSSSLVRVLRPGISDTLSFKVVRKEIKVESVSYYGFVNDSIAIIKLDRFSRKSAQEIRDALDSLHKSDNKLKGLILDLRDNGGGVLDAAISICEIFVPKGSKIVTTRGRKSSDERVYTSDIIPYEGTLPLAVLINNRSASASEVVAGALQDVDRAVVLGERSFGKGLVQSILPLAHNASLKITTSKYFTPSGRSIQKISYFKKDSAFDSSKQFRTINNRIVYEHNGIAPDSTLSDVYKLPVIAELLNKDIIFDYVNLFCARYEIAPKIPNESTLIQDFEKFAKQKKFLFESRTTKKLNELYEIAENEKSNSSVLAKLNSLKLELQKQQSMVIKQNSTLIYSILEREIFSRFSSNKASLQRFISQDKQVQTSAAVLHSNYKQILKQ